MLRALMTPRLDPRYIIGYPGGQKKFYNIDPFFLPILLLVARKFVSWLILSVEALRLVGWYLLKDIYKLIQTLLKPNQYKLF